MGSDSRTGRNICYLTGFAWNGDQRIGAASAQFLTVDRAKRPLFVGDTLYAESEVLEKRESKSRPGAGIVTCKSDGYNQDGKLVCTFNRTMLIAKRGHSVEDKVNY